MVKYIHYLRFEIVCIAKMDQDPLAPMQSVVCYLYRFQRAFLIALRVSLLKDLLIIQLPLLLSVFALIYSLCFFLAHRPTCQTICEPWKIRPRACHFRRYMFYDYLFDMI